MDSKPVVSVIVPVRNGELLLAEALTSVRDQTFARLEAITVDDGSTDGSADVARRFCREDPRFRLVSLGGAGVSAARNEGIRHASGEWIAFLDADDLWFPQKLARQMEEVRKEPRADFLFSNYVEWRDGVDFRVRYASERKLPRGACLPRLVYSNLFGTSTVMVRRELLDRAGHFDTMLTAAEDWDLWLRMAETSWHPVGIQEPLVRYRLWSGNASKQTLRTAESDLKVLDRRAAQCTVPALIAPYREAAAIARGNLEFAWARRLFEENPGALASAALRAWRHYPKRLKWLLWYLAASWPLGLEVGPRASGFGKRSKPDGDPASWA